jgi:hypothetical protein
MLIVHDFMFIVNHIYIGFYVEFSFITKTPPHYESLSTEISMELLLWNPGSAFPNEVYVPTFAPSHQNSVPSYNDR